MNKKLFLILGIILLLLIILFILANLFAYQHICGTDPSGITTCT
ncbi:MAG TPA: hypothetical protein VFE88_02040 [Candidatus Nanoarchaeia archaeon]|nr:hypothetical protein [Candidatus Nanoarchaeia archaeon]